MYNYYDFLITVRYLFNDNSERYWIYETHKGSVIASSEQGAKDLIKELFTGNEASSTENAIQISSCEIMKITPVIPAVVDYRIIDIYHQPL